MIKSAIAKLGIVAVLAGISPRVQVIVGAGLGTQSWISPITYKLAPALTSQWRGTSYD